MEEVVVVEEEDSGDETYEPADRDAVEDSEEGDSGVQGG